MSPDEYPKVYLYRRLVQAKLFIDEHFAEPIDLDVICNTAFFSKFHFIRLFKKTYGNTPHQYLTAIRMERAKELLSGGINVSRACNEVGFDSITSFTGLFKRRVGVSPMIFQKQEQERKKETENAPLKFVPFCFADSKGWIQKSNFEEG